MSTCCSWGARFGGIATTPSALEGWTALHFICFHLFWRKIQGWIQISWYFSICQGVLLTPQSVVKQDIVNLLLCLNCYNDLKVNCLLLLHCLLQKFCFCPRTCWPCFSFLKKPDYCLSKVRSTAFPPVVTS